MNSATRWDWTIWTRPSSPPTVNGGNAGGRGVPPWCPAQDVAAPNTATPTALTVPTSAPLVDAVFGNADLTASLALPALPFAPSMPIAPTSTLLPALTATLLSRTAAIATALGAPAGRQQAGLSWHGTWSRQDGRRLPSPPPTTMMARRLWPSAMQRCTRKAGACCSTPCRAMARG